MLEGCIIGIVIAGIGLVNAAMQRGSSVIGSKPSRLQSFTSAGNPQESMKAIVCFAQQAGYKIPAIDEAKGQLVLEESASLTSWFFSFRYLFHDSRITPSWSTLVSRASWFK